MAELASLLVYYFRPMTLLSSDGISQVKSLFIEGVFSWPYNRLVLLKPMPEHPSQLQIDMNDAIITLYRTRHYSLPSPRVHYNPNHRCGMKHQVL